MKVASHKLKRKKNWKYCLNYKKASIMRRNAMREKALIKTENRNE